MSIVDQHDVAEPPVRDEAILLNDAPVDVGDDDRMMVIETLGDLIAGDQSVAQPAIAVWTSRSRGRSSILRQLYFRLDRSYAVYRRPSLRLKPRPQPQKRRTPEVRTRLTRAWAWRRAGQIGQGWGYDIASFDDSQPTCPVVVDVRACQTLDDIRSVLSRTILTTIGERLPGPQAGRLWFDLNVRRTDRARLRRRILASYLPQSMPGALVAVLLVCAAAVLLLRRVVAPAATVSTTDLIAMVGVVATVVGYIVQAKTGHRDASDHVSQGSPLADLLDLPTPGVDPFLLAWDQDLIDVLMLVGSETKIVLLIDDLDRCSPQMTAGVLEAVRWLPGTVIVAAFDPALVAGQLEARTPWLRERAVADPVAYGQFDRLGWTDLIAEFDVSIRLPAPSGRLYDRLVQALSDPPSAFARPVEPQLHPVDVEAEPGLAPEPPMESLNLAALQADSRVLEALKQATASVAGGSAHKARVLINLWRFYVTVEYRCGRLTPPAADCARAVVYFVHLVLAWPWLLEGLAPTNDRPSRLRGLADASGDDDLWAAACADIDAPSGLRDLLRHSIDEREALLELADRYL